MTRVRITDIDVIEPNRHGLWLDWLHRHGIDPRDVPIPSEIQVSRASRRIRYVALARDPDGQPRIEQSRRTGRPGDELAREWKTVQLDRCPAPFPVFAR